MAVDALSAATTTFSTAMNAIQNQKNRQLALRMQDDQINATKAMQSQAHQWDVENAKNADSYKVQSLKAAGLNPALAYNGTNNLPASPMGSASAGNMPQQFDLGKNIASLPQNALAAAQMSNLQAQTKLTNEQARTQSIENDNKENYNEVIAHREEVMRDGIMSNWIKNHGGIDAFQEIWKASPAEAKARAEKFDAEFQAMMSKLKTESPEYYNAIINQPGLANLKTEKEIELEGSAIDLNKSNTTLNQAKTENVKMDTQVKETEIYKNLAQVKNINADTILKSAQTLTEWARESYLKGLCNKIPSEIALLNSKTSYTDLQTDKEHFTNLEYMVTEVARLESEGKQVPTQLKAAIASMIMNTLVEDVHDVAKEGLFEFARRYASNKADHILPPVDPVSGKMIHQQNEVKSSSKTANERIKKIRKDKDPLRGINSDGEANTPEKAAQDAMEILSNEITQ